jgi:hypothetical protein
MRKRRRAWDFDPNKIQSAKISMADRDDVHEEVSKLLAFRDHTLVLKTELPTSADIVRSLIPQEIIESVAIIQSRAEWHRAFNRGNSLFIHFSKVPEEQLRSLSHDPDRWEYEALQHMHNMKYGIDGLPVRIPLPRIEYNDAVIMFPDHPLYAPLVDYGMQMQALKQATNTTLNLVGLVTRNCNTWGQVRRVWPELFTFLPTSTGKVRVVNEQKQQSRLPETISSDPELAQELARGIAQANVVLTQAVLLKSSLGPAQRLPMHV